MLNGFPFVYRSHTSKCWKTQNVCVWNRKIMFSVFKTAKLSTQSFELKNWSNVEISNFLLPHAFYKFKIHHHSATIHWQSMSNSGILMIREYMHSWDLAIAKIRYHKKCSWTPCWFITKSNLQQFVKISNWIGIFYVNMCINS